MTDQSSPTENERWWAPGLTPRPGGNPPDVPADYLYDPESDVYWNPRRPGTIRPRTTPPVIDRRVLPNGEVKEWERTRTIPDDFIYDPETDSYYPPGEPCTYDFEAKYEEAKRLAEEVKRKYPNGPPPPIYVDLRSDGPTRPGKPAKGRKKKSTVDKKQRELFSSEADDDVGEPAPTPVDQYEDD